MYVGNWYTREGRITEIAEKKEGMYKGMYCDYRSMLTKKILVYLKEWKYFEVLVNGELQIAKWCMGNESNPCSASVILLIHLPLFCLILLQVTGYLKKLFKFHLTSYLSVLHRQILILCI